ncbi:MAG: ferrous iron transport protein B [Flavobacteriales bacterium]|jgi:ferrous iron transport protein B
MAKAAVVFDRLMAMMGLPDNLFIRLIVGFGCNVPSVMVTRTLTREQNRLLTMSMCRLFKKCRPIIYQRSIVY